MSSAVLSDDGVYRYVLRRQWPLTLEGSDLARPVPFTCMFIMLNPSTADAMVDDPTIRRCVSFARRWGYEQLLVCNLFAYRATDPRFLYREDPGMVVGPENDDWIVRCANEASVIVAGWGEHGGYLNRDEQVVELLTHGDRPMPIHCLARNASGRPKHPLYIRNDAVPVLL